MKKSDLKLLPIFLTFPFLMGMYNGPYFHVPNYDSYDVTYVSHEKVEDDYIYTINIKHNSGYHYIYSLELKGTIEEEKYSGDILPPLKEVGASCSMTLASQA